jgi:hypothetical protein
MTVWYEVEVSLSNGDTVCLHLSEAAVAEFAKDLAGKGVWDMGSGVQLFQGGFIHVQQGEATQHLIARDEIIAVQIVRVASESPPSGR